MKQYALLRGVETPVYRMMPTGTASESSGQRPGACDACPGISVLKVAGPCRHGFQLPARVQGSVRGGVPWTIPSGVVLAMAKVRTTHRGLAEELTPAVEELVSSLQASELECLTVQAITEHRRLLEIAEEAYEAMMRAESHGGEPGQYREPYVRAMLNNKAQLALVNLLVERLGYLPEVEK